MPNLEYPLNQKQCSIRYHQEPYSKQAGVLFPSSKSTALFTNDPTPTFYQHVFKELPKEAGIVVYECQCLPGYVRESSSPHNSLRGLLDFKVTQMLSKFSWRIEKPTLFFFGSGKLLNESTILAGLMNNGVSPRIVLIDRAYATGGEFYEPEAVSALDKFKLMIDHLAKTFRVTYELHVVVDFQNALQTFAQGRVPITAFFMLDVFFSSTAINFFKTEIHEGFMRAQVLDLSYDTFFFLLNKKADGPIRFPRPEHVKRPPYHGFDAASLNIHAVRIANGTIVQTQLLFESIF